MNPENLEIQKAYNKVFSYIKIAAKGRNIVTGEFMTENAIKGMQACLVIVATDSSDNTKKLFTNKTDYYEVPYYEFSTKEELGKVLGKKIVASMAFIDEGLANAAMKQLEIYISNKDS